MGCMQYAMYGVVPHCTCCGMAVLAMTILTPQWHASTHYTHYGYACYAHTDYTYASTLCLPPPSRGPPPCPASTLCLPPPSRGPPPCPASTLSLPPSSRGPPPSPAPPTTPMPTTPMLVCLPPPSRGPPPSPAPMDRSSRPSGPCSAAWRCEYASRATLPSKGGCNPVRRRLQPYVTEAATLCDGCCNPM